MSERAGTGVEQVRGHDQEFVAGLTEGEGRAAFTQPWELRAFAVAVAAHEAGQYQWPEFQRSLVESIRRWENEPHDPQDWSYYEHWLTALEAVLAEHGLLGEDDLDDRTKAILATPRDAAHHKARTEPLAIDPARV
jgi:nitrile hydratase accessory protein